jgi:UDP-N-acetylglucosamine diphosphorylase/glucosamine-1-phosphate N-acetyltransferase
MQIMETFLFLCMRINLFDQEQIRQNLLPFTFTRPVASIRIGILRISEKWQKRGFDIGFQTQDYLESKFPSTESELSVNGALCPTDELVEAVRTLKQNEQLVAGEEVLAKHGNASIKVEFDSPYLMLNHTWDIFLHNASEIKIDFELITKGRKSEPITDPHTIVYNSENIFLEEGVSIKAAVLNAENGPIYLGKNSEVHEGSHIRGSFALCEGAHVNMGAKIRGDSTIGPFSKVGGEVANSVIFANSSKGHEGYLGNSVIGEWCNLGADTNTSNLKNNYAQVKVWDYSKEGFKNSGLQFCGLMMADHAKCGINTMFNTGTVVGVGANIFGSGFPRNFVPSFSWGGAAGFSTFQLRKFDEVAEAVMKRKDNKFDETEKGIIRAVFDLTSQYRIWDKK